MSFVNVLFVMRAPGLGFDGLAVCSVVVNWISATADYARLSQQPSVRCQQLGTTGCLSFHPIVQCVVHALKGLACRARVTPASSPASHCEQCSALTSPALHARGCASPSRAHRGNENIKYFSMGPKLRHPAVCAYGLRCECGRLMH